MKPEDWCYALTRRTILNKVYLLKRVYAHYLITEEVSFVVVNDISK